MITPIHPNKDGTSPNNTIHTKTTQRVVRPFKGEIYDISSISKALK